MRHRHVHFQGIPQNWPKCARPSLYAIYSLHISPKSSGSTTYGSPMAKDLHLGSRGQHRVVSIFPFSFYYLAMTIIENPSPQMCLSFQLAKVLLGKKQTNNKNNKNKPNIIFLLYFCSNTSNLPLGNMNFSIYQRKDLRTMEEKENTKVHILRSYVATCIQVRDKGMHIHVHMNTLYHYICIRI